MAFHMTTRLLCRKNIPVLAVRKFRSLNGVCSSLSTTQNIQKRELFRFKNWITGCCFYSDASEDFKRMSAKEWDTTVMDMLALIDGKRVLPKFESESEAKKLSFLGHTPQTANFRNEIFKMLESGEVDIAKMEEMFNSIDWPESTSKSAKIRVLSLVFRAYIKVEDSDKALDIWKQILDIDPYYFSRTYQALMLYKLMVRQDKIDEAIVIMNDFGRSYIKLLPKEQRKEIEAAIFKTAHHFFGTECCLPVHDTFRVSNTLVKLTEMYYPIINFLKGYLIRGNDDDILEAFCLVARVFQTCQFKVQDIMRHFINTGNEAALQKVVLISNDLRGPLVTCVDLTLMFSSTGNYASADKLYQRVYADDEWNMVLQGRLNELVNSFDGAAVDRVYDFLKDKGVEDIDLKFKNSVSNVLSRSQNRKQFLLQKIREHPDGILNKFLLQMSGEESGFADTM